MQQVKKDTFRKEWTDIKDGDPNKYCTLVKKPLNFQNVFGDHVSQEFLDLEIAPMSETDPEGLKKIEIGT